MVSFVFRFVFLASLMFVFSGCTITSQDVVISPDLPVEERNIGNGKTMMVQVKDERLREHLGYRTRFNTGVIYLDNAKNFTSDIKKVIEHGFSKYGFSIIQKGIPDRDVVIYIRLIEFDSFAESFSHGAFIHGTFKVTCITPSGKRFENLYRVEHQHYFPFNTFATTNDRWINEVVSDALMRMFNDPDFLEFLGSSE